MAYNSGRSCPTDPTTGAAGTSFLRYYPCTPRTTTATRTGPDDQHLWTLDPLSGKTPLWESSPCFATAALGRLQWTSGEVWNKGQLPPGRHPLPADLWHDTNYGSVSQQRLHHFNRITAGDIPCLGRHPPRWPSSSIHPTTATQSSTCESGQHSSFQWDLAKPSTKMSSSGSWSWCSCNEPSWRDQCMFSHQRPEIQWTSSPVPQYPILFVWQRF